MEYIFHEQQEGALCAQHCLNALLQKAEFTAVDLSVLAQQLDESERIFMAEAGVGSSAYQHFIEQPSANYDDSGFFSVQVIQKALEIWNLEMVQITSQHEIAKAARENPVGQKAFICNLKEHWFTLRKLGFQWFNLNSLLAASQLISDTYLNLYLEQLKTEGFSIFVINGELHECAADQALRLTPAVQIKRPAVAKKRNASEVTDKELARALEESRRLAEPEEDPALQQAMEMSMQDHRLGGPSNPGSSAAVNAAEAEPAPVDPAEVRRRRLLHLERSTQPDA